MVKNKSKSLKSRFNLPLIFTTVILILGFAISKIVVNRQSAGINMIAPFPSISPLPFPIVSTCGSIKTFSTAGLCAGTGQFKIAYYTCSTTSGTKTIDNSKTATPCRTVANLFNTAYRACAAVCIKPSPTPTATPTPTPTPTPTSYEISSSVTYPIATKPRLYYGLYDGYINITVTRSSGEKYNYAMRSSPAANSIEFPFTTNINETFSMKVHTSNDNTVTDSNVAMGWIKPNNNKCGLSPFMLVDISSFLTNVQNFDSTQKIISTQCWADSASSGTPDFNDFVFVWTDAPTN